MAVSDVFDILMRIGVTDEITGTLSKIGGSFEELHHQIESLGGGFEALTNHAGTFGAALVALATTGIASLDKIGQAGDRLGQMFGRMEADSWTAMERSQAGAVAYATALKVPQARIEDIVQDLHTLRDLTGRAVPALAPLLEGQERLKAIAQELGGEGGPKAVDQMMKLFTGLGMSPEAAQEAIARELRTLAGGNVTPQQLASDIAKLRESGRFFTPEMLNVILPTLERTSMGGRISPAMGLEEIFKKMQPSAKTGQPEWFERQALGPGVSIRQYGNDPYEFAQAAMKMLVGQGLNVAEARRVSGPDRQMISDYIHSVLGLQGAGADVMAKMMLEGETALGEKSPFARERARPPMNVEEVFEGMSKEPGFVREGMYATIHNFIVTLGDAVGHWEVDKMNKIIDQFQHWTTIIHDLEEKDPNKIHKILDEVSQLLAVIGGMGAGLLGFKAGQMALSPAGSAAIGLGLLSAAIVDLAKHWDQNKGSFENLRDVNRRWGEESNKVNNTIRETIESFFRELNATARKEHWSDEFNKIAGVWVGDFMNKLLSVGATVNRWQDAALAWVNAMVTGLVNAIRNINWWELFKNAISGAAAQASPQHPTMPETEGGPPGRFVPGFTPSSAVPAAAAAGLSSIVPTANQLAAAVAADRRPPLAPPASSLRPTLTDSFTEALKNMDNKLQTTLPPRGAPRVVPFGPSSVLPSFSAPSTTPSRDRIGQSAGVASPVSFTGGGGPVMPSGGGQRAKGVTIATNLNIDGRLLAQAVSDHILSMLSDPSGAASADWLSLPHGPGSGYTAA